MKKDTIIKIKNLNVNYNDTNALKDINFEINKGDYLGIIGPNGGGKSTLLKSISGLIKYNGDIIFVNKDGKKPKLGYVPQFSAIDKRFPINVMEVVLSGKTNKGLRPFFKYNENDIDMAYFCIEKVGLKGLENRHINELSGGEFQKLLIARAIISNPDILLLDEPTANIDKASCSTIYSLLSDLNKDMTIILVTHDLFAVSQSIKTIACLNKTLVYHGAPELSSEIINKLYGCPVDLIAHGTAHRVLSVHEENNK